MTHDHKPQIIKAKQLKAKCSDSLGNAKLEPHALDYEASSQENTYRYVFLLYFLKGRISCSICEPVDKVDVDDISLGCEISYRLA